jgi:hypothetical protein
MTRLLVPLFMLLASVASAQAAPSPHPIGGLLPLGTDSLEVYLVRQGRRQRTGYIVDHLDTVRVGAEIRLRRVYSTMDQVLGRGTDTLVDRFSDLTPRSVASRSSLGGTETVEWRGARVVGSVATPNKPSRSIDTTTSPITYSAASFDLILRASPLTTGYRVAVPAFSGRQGPATLTAYVAGEESLPGLGVAWRVEANFAGLPVTFWIDKKTRRLLQQSMKVAPGTEVVLLVPGDSAR